MGVRELAKRILTDKENRKYERLLKSREVTYGDWLAEQEKIWAQDGDWPGVPGQTDAGGDPDFVLIRAGRGSLASGAERWIRRWFLENPEVQILYGDEDVRTAEGEYRSPWFKPDWSPDLFDSCLYFGGITAVRRELWEERKRFYSQEDPDRYKMIFTEPGEDGSCGVRDLGAYERWLHDCVKEAYRKGSRKVGHIPRILFHGESEAEQKRFLEESEYLAEKKRALLTGFYEARGREQETGKPFLSVIIPSKDQPDILEQCVAGVKKAAARIPLEIVVVDNGSDAEKKSRAEQMLRREAEPDQDGFRCRIRYLYQPMEFNFSRMCNLGAGQAEGKLLLFLNDDVILEKDCIGELAARAERSYTGAAGLKLLYPGTGRIQHAGITNLPMGPVHKLQSMKDEGDYYGKANHCGRNFLAVTAACLMVEKEKFTEAGGFCEELAVAFNDVDFCFRLYELGYHNLCLNDVWAYHYESLSRGDDESPQKLKRLQAERSILYRRHPMLEGRDPYYSVFLNREGLDVRIAPAYPVSRNRAQTAGKAKILTELSGCREDRCLLVRTEDVSRGKIVGWCVVLGDNNACYEKKLLFRRLSETEAEEAQDGVCREKEAGFGDSTVYEISLEGQYRPDLEENMPDQVNVALSGFALELSEGVLPPGSYGVGAYAGNRVTGLRLINWSSRVICVQRVSEVMKYRQETGDGSDGLQGRI